MLWVIFFTAIASATELQKQNARLLKTNKILLQTLQKISSETAVGNQNAQVSGAEDVCTGKACGECLDDTDYACAFYDGKCILSSSMKDYSAYKASKFVWMSEDCPAKCEDVSIMDGYLTCGGLNEMFNGNICKFDYGAPGGPCSCMCDSDDICEGKACGECLDDTDYACAFYDGKCISSEAMSDPSEFKMSKFVWTSDMCPAAVGMDQLPIVSMGVEDVCTGKACGECLDGTDYACSFYDGKCILSESMKDPSAYKGSKFVWASDDCPTPKCEDVSIMDGYLTCGGLNEIFQGDICKYDYGAPGSPCSCMCEKKGKKAKKAECSTASDCESPYIDCWMGMCVTEISVADELCTCTGRYSGWVAGGEACQFGNNCAPRSRCSNPNGKPCVFEA